MRRVAHVAPLAGFALLLSAALPASDLGYWYRLALQAGSPSGQQHWVSVPYLYSPPDVNSNLLLDAEDLAQDLQPIGLPHPCTQAADNCAVAEVAGWDEVTGTYISWTSGGAGTPFTLEPGEAYRLTLQAVSGQSLHVVDVAGTHDPTLSFSECYVAGGVNLRWVSLPPHLAVGTSSGITGVLDAEDLGQAMGGAPAVFMVRQLNPSTGRYEGWVVGSAYGTPFAVDTTRGCGVDILSCPWDWAPPTQ